MDDDDDYEDDHDDVAMKLCVTDVAIRASASHYGVTVSALQI